MLKRWRVREKQKKKQKTSGVRRESEEAAVMEVGG